MRRTRLLVTGFGPFPGMPENPSEAVARAIAQDPRWRRRGIEALCLPLPTTYAAIDGVLNPALRALRPDAILMLGVAGKAREIRVERCGRNRVGTSAPDAEGFRPPAPMIVPGAPARSCRADPHRQASALKRQRLRAKVSADAGDYLCNASYFAALKEPVPVLFVHIPRPGRGFAASLPAGLWRVRLAAALCAVAEDLIRQARGRPARRAPPRPGPRRPTSRSSWR